MSLVIGDSVHKSKPDKNAVMLMIERDGRFLFVRRAAGRAAAGYWCPVSGRVEQGETQEQTVAREALEEVGLRVRAVRKVGEMPNSAGDYLLHWWTTELEEPRTEATIAAPDEIDDLRWVAPSEFSSLHPAFAEDLDFILMQWKAS